MTTLAVMTLNSFARSRDCLGSKGLGQIYKPEYRKAYK